MPRKPPPPVKSAAERLTEGLTILRKLQEVGIVESEPGYQETKRLINAWVRAVGTPEDAGAEHTILFPRYGRRGVMLLPVRAGRIATYALKVDDVAAAEAAAAAETAETT